MERLRLTVESELLIACDCEACAVLNAPSEVPSVEMEALLLTTTPATDALTLLRVLLIPATELLTPPNVELTVPSPA